MRARRSRIFICAAFIVAVVFLVLTTPAFAAGPGWTWSNGTFTALQGTPALPNVTPLGISPDGSYVVGYGVGTTPPVQRALVWHPRPWFRSGVTELGTLGSNMSSAYDVNNAGHAVGFADVAYDKPVAVLFAHGHVTPLRPGDAYSAANAINKYDLVVGDATMADGHTWAYSWQAGTMTELPHLPRWLWSTAYDVNDAGQIAGMAVLIDGTTLAVEWSMGGVVVLPNLPLGHPDSAAFSINARGDIAGSAMDANGDGYAVVWRKGLGDIWTCKIVGNLGSYALGINDAGSVVGTSPAGTGFHAFLYRSGLTDLGTLFPWPTSQARGISNQNIVIGCNDYV